MIDGRFTDSYSACYIDQYGGKDAKKGLSVAQNQQSGEGAWPPTFLMPTVLSTIHSCVGKKIRVRT